MEVPRRLAYRLHPDHHPVLLGPFPGLRLAVGDDLHLVTLIEVENCTECSEMVKSHPDVLVLVNPDHTHVHPSGTYKTTFTWRFRASRVGNGTVDLRARTDFAERPISIPIAVQEVVA